MTGDKMANTKADPYQDPAYHPPDPEPHPVVETRTMEPPNLARTTQACIKDDGAERIESFVQGQVDDMLKRTHAQAEADSQQAGQDQAEKRELENSR